jgi:hypothetical protein
MRILYCTNLPQRGPCGVAEYGNECWKALLKYLPRLHPDEALELVVWEPTLQQHWPDRDLSVFDVIHLNYHAATIGFVQPPPVKPRLLSAFIHEPASGHWFGEADVLFSAEPEMVAGHVGLFMPVPDADGYAEVANMVSPEDGKGLICGTSTLRSAGVDWAAPVLDAAGITFDYGQHKSHWFTMAEEVRRLSTCDFLIYWYGGANPGQSAGVMTGVAAQRPIVLNSNRMFESLRGYDGELYRAATPEEGIALVVSDLRAGCARIPRRLRVERSWANAVKVMEGAWGAVRSR